MNLSSIYGNFPVAGAAVYGATKTAVDFLSESLRVESQGAIKVTTIKPIGVPATGLGASVVNGAAVVGILGHNVESEMARFAARLSGEGPASESDPESIDYSPLEPEYIADTIVHAIDQPWGVSLGNITVRATGDGYVL